jgi:DNA-binding CsgD family transcriptional regulator
MNYQPNILIELAFTVIQFATLWVIFYLLHRPETKWKQRALIGVMVLWHPLNISASVFFSLPIAAKVLLQAAAFFGLVFLSDGKKRDRAISVLYLWNIGLLTDVAFSCVFTGVTGELSVVNMNSLYFQMTVTRMAMLLWAVFYYLIMRRLPQTAIDIVSARFWIIAVFTPLLGAEALFAAINPLKTQLENGFNNFLFCGAFGIVILALDICIFYLYIKLIGAYHSRVLASELANTPPVYTAQSGLSPAFAEKYNLSKRQIEIIEKILSGKSNKEIAVELNIEVNTVQVHLQNIYRKTGTSGRFAVMALVGIATN